MRSGSLKHLGSMVATVLAKALAPAAAIVIFATVPYSVSAQQPKADQPSPQRCIAIVMPEVQGVPGNAVEVASGLRDLMASYLTGPSLKVVSLEARLPSQAAEEAKQKGCEPLLLATVTRKSGGGGRGFSKVLGQAADRSSWGLYGGSSAASAAARAGAAGGVQAVASLAQSTKARDEVRLEYRLQSASGEVQFGPKTETRTAKADGEDLLTPVVAKAAEAIVTRKLGK